MGNRSKHIRSILPDELDVIEEDTEESSSSIASESRYSIQKESKPITPWIKGGQTRPIDDSQRRDANSDREEKSPLEDSSRLYPADISPVSAVFLDNRTESQGIEEASTYTTEESLSEGSDDYRRFSSPRSHQVEVRDGSISERDPGVKNSIMEYDDYLRDSRVRTVDESSGLSESLRTDEVSDHRGHSSPLTARLDAEDYTRNADINGKGKSNRSQSPKTTERSGRPIAEETVEGALFNYDEDFTMGAIKEPEPVEELLTWRLDPSKSLSDWEIKVFNKETRTSECFHVHKNILAVGRRRSEYFVRSFRANNRLAVTGDQMTEVWLASVAAKVMPEFLDFMYSTEGDLQVTTETATGLRHLAQFFGIRIMHKKVMDFILSDMAMDNVFIYYRDSVVVDDDKIAELAANQCAKNIMKIDTTSPLMSAVDPAFFRRIMASPEIDSKEKHYHTSLLLAEYCTLNKSTMDDQDFVRLTDQRYLPHVDHNAALTLMEMEADLVISTSSDEFSGVTSLQQRCIEDLTAHWKQLSEKAQETVMRVCRKLPSSVVAELLVKSLAQAKHCFDKEANNAKAPRLQLPRGESSKSVSSTKSSELKREIARVKKECDAKMASLKREHQQAIDAMKEGHEAELLKLREMCAEKDRHLNSYWDELKRFERLPNTVDGKKMIPSGMMQKPSKMPTIGNQSIDGYLYKKDGSRHPVFFYKID